jgi:hypothetical protein
VRTPRALCERVTAEAALTPGYILSAWEERGTSTYGKRVPVATAKTLQPLSRELLCAVPEMATGCSTTVVLTCLTYNAIV